MGTLHSINTPASINAYGKDAGPTEEVRLVPISESHAKVIQEAGIRLSSIGAPTTGLVLIGIAAAWKVGRAA